SSSMSDIFDDLFGEFMGGRGGRRGRRSDGGRSRGQDLRYNMELSLEEAYEGKKAQVRVPSSISCEACQGSGAEPGSKPVTCTTCQGMGKVRATQGFFTVERTDRKSTRLNSSHVKISYAVFSLKKNNTLI